MAEDSTNGPFCTDGALPQAAFLDWAHRRQSEASGLDLLQHLLDSSPFGILVHDAAGRILAYNRRLEEISGYSSAEIPDIHTWIEKVYPDPAYRRVVLRGRAEPKLPDTLRERDAAITRRDGAKRMCHFLSMQSEEGIRTVFIRDAHSSSNHIQGLFRGEDRFHAFYQYAPLPVFSFQRADGDFVLVSYNYAAAEFFGPQIERYLGTPASEILADRADILKCMEACFSQRKTIRQEFQISVPSDESQKKVAATFMFVEPNFVMVHVEDLTGPRKSEEKFALAFQMSASGLAITTLEEGRYIDVNRSECLMCGYRREELIGRTTFELGIWADPAAGWRMRRRLEKHGAVRNFEYRIRRKSGEIRHGLVSASIIETGGQRYILSEAVDMTELKDAEQAMRKSRDELEQRVQERTQALQRMTTELDEANTALRVMLRQCDQDRQELEENLLYNARRLILPYVRKLKRQHLSASSRNIVAVIESKINDLISPAAKALGHSGLGLTPMELRVADLIQQGSASKQIAALLGLSIRTIETHRKNVRTKLGLSNKKENLRGVLLSMAQAGRPSQGQGRDWLRKTRGAE
jgi:PAS domain S-box-containing protein